MNWTKIIGIMLGLMPLCLAQDTDEPTTQTFGPSGIMDTSPIVQVPIVDEDPIDLVAIRKIPLEQRLAKYEFMLGDLPRAGNFTPYYKGQLLGNLNTNSATEPSFIPFIWLAPENNTGKRIPLSDVRYSHRPYSELELTGHAAESSAWKTRTIPIAPGKLYRFSVFASSSEDGGELTAGTDFAQSRWKDLKALPARTPNDWRDPSPVRRSFLFLAPEGKETIQVHVGPGKEGFTYGISRVHVEPVFPIYRGIQSSVLLDVKTVAGTSSFIGLPGGEPKNTDNRGGDFLRLGDGEQIKDGKYQFKGTFGNNGFFHRPIQSTTATFDTDRLIFVAGDELIYRFELQPIRIDEKPGHFVPPAITFGKTTVQFTIRDTVQFTLRDIENTTASPEWSTDGTRWESAAQTFNAQNAKTLFVRLKNTGTGSFAVGEVSLEAEVYSKDYAGEGKTVIALLRQSDNDRTQLPEGCKVVPLMFSADNAIYKLFINESEDAQSFGAGYMDYSGTEDNIGGHGDGPGKWTQISFGSGWGAVRPHQSRVDVWVYNWLRGNNFFVFYYPGLSFSYEIVQPPKINNNDEEK